VLYLTLHFMICYSVEPNQAGSCLNKQVVFSVRHSSVCVIMMRSHVQPLEGGIQWNSSMQQCIKICQCMEEGRIALVLNNDNTRERVMGLRNSENEITPCEDKKHYDCCVTYIT